MATVSNQSKDPERNDSEADYTGMGRAFAKVVAPPTFIAALMVYFGWVHSDVVYRVFGVDQSTLGLSLQDYMFRSVGPMVEPLVWLLFAVVALMPLHRLLDLTLSGRPTAARWAAWGTAAAGALLCLAGALGAMEINLVKYPTELPIIPMSVGLGVLLVGYANHLCGLTVRRRFWPEAESRLPRLVIRMAVVGLLFVLSFWSVAIYAQMRGKAVAEDLVADPKRLPGVVVYTPKRLHIEGPGVVEFLLPRSANEISQYRYRYDGLRLLIRANNQYFLLPACWTANGRARAIALADDRFIRMEFFKITNQRTPCV